MARTGLRGLWIGLAAAVALAGAAHAVSPGPHTEVFTRQTPDGEVKVAARVMGSGPLVVLVPSLGRGASDFDDLLVRLADAGFKAAAIDPRGVGKSAGPTQGVTLFDYADDVAAAAQGLSKGKAVLVGHAFGNRVVRAAAARHPDQVERLVLFAAGGQVPIRPQVLKALNAVFDPALPPAEHLAAVKLAFFAEGADPGLWTGGWHGDVARAQQAALAATPPDQWTGGGAVPILVVQAAEDAVAPPANAEALKKASPDRVEVVVLPHAGHAMLPEQPRELAQILIGYLKRAR
jgi:pimeloyl-ACP methyl ester carboxylesterase